jgi:hypothetical protein
MSVENTIPVRDAVEACVRATGSSPSLAEQIVAELREPDTLRLDLPGDALSYFIKDGRAVVERARFDALMARVRQLRRDAETM